jgi:hypothetical protein
VARTIRISLPGILLAAAACTPSALPLRDDPTSAASVHAAEAPMPVLPPIAGPGAPAPKQVPAASPHEHGAVAPTPSAVIYSCSMHPEVRAAQPGKCPSCGMTLERLEAKP